MNTNHTPAPWKTIIAQPGTMLEVVSENNKYVCSLLGGEEHKQANGRLIAAAPELLEALQIAAQMIVTCGMTHPADFSKADKKNLDKINAAIAKATL